MKSSNSPHKARKGLELYDFLCNYVKEHGFLRVNCVLCQRDFICSGHCLSKRKEEFTNSYSYKEDSGCICGRCDVAKLGKSDWYSLCEKEGDEVEWLIRRLAKKKTD